MNLFSIEEADGDIKDLINVYRALDSWIPWKRYTQRSKAILYASMILLLYNYVEWSVKADISKVFHEYNKDNVKFWNLIKEWKIYLLKNEHISIDVQKKWENIVQKIVDLYPEMSFWYYEDIKSIIKNWVYKIKNENPSNKKAFFDINGNLNEERIIQIAKNLGIQFSLSSERLNELYREKFITNELESKTFFLKKDHPLHFVMTERNKLAHWQIVFSQEEYSNYTTNDIEELANSIVLYIEQFNMVIDNFIRLKNWRIWENGKKKKKVIRERSELMKRRNIKKKKR